MPFRLALLGIVGVAVGGGAGAVARHFLAGAVQRAVPGEPGNAFPWGTLLVNVLGCLALGALVAWDARASISPEVRLALATGVLGGFTTYSGYALETLRLLQDGHLVRAALYLLAANALCLGAVALGLRLGGRA